MFVTICANDCRQSWWDGIESSWRSGQKADSDLTVAWGSAAKAAAVSEVEGQTAAAEVAAQVSAPAGSPWAGTAAAYMPEGAPDMADKASVPEDTALAAQDMQQEAEDRTSVG